MDQPISADDTGTARRGVQLGRQDPTPGAGLGEHGVDLRRRLDGVSPAPIPDVGNQCSPRSTVAPRDRIATRL
jgi:hypothetical protein